MATVLVGDDPASHTYVRMKANRCRAAGLDSRRHDLPAQSDTADVIRLVRQLSEDAQVDGILVQHPMPSHINEREVFDAIAPTKDVDGVTTASFAAMSFSEPGFASCTPAGIMRLLDAYEVPLAGQDAVVVGRSPILGKPVGMMLLARDATVTFCHSKTANLAAAVRRADIVVAAVGRPELIRGDWIKPGAIVIDAGYNADNVGDVEYAAAADKARLNHTRARRGRPYDDRRPARSNNPGRSRVKLELTSETPQRGQDSRRTEVIVDGFVRH